MTGLPDYGVALSRALESAAPLGATERVALADASGRVLARPIAADRDLPPFDRAQMDGYALRGAEVGRVAEWPVTATIAAGQPADVAVPPGTCVAIATGAPLPAGVDTVIRHELSDRGDPVRFGIDQVTVGQAVHPRGADARAGDVLVGAGTMLAAHHLGIAAAVGAVQVEVVRAPRAVVLTSGDEVRAPDETPRAHEIRNSNAVQTCELLRRFGATPFSAVHVRDERDETIAAVGAALAACDLLVTIGGISAGDRDHFPAAFETHGVARTLHGAAIQPGKPVLVGRTPAGTCVVGLPGNPVSSLVCATLFAWPLVRVMLGLDPGLPWEDVVLAAPVRPNARRRAFRPAVRDGDGLVTVPRWAGSGDLAHTATTNGLVELPVQDEEVPAGTEVRFLRWA